jgi:predicted ATPase/class 3 adenylate cyclase
MPADPAPRTLTFLFTDLEGSTRLWERFPEAMRPVIARHDAILHGAVEAWGGQVVKTTGDGLMAIFSSVAAAVSACVTAQRKLMQESWGEVGSLRVRMGLHSGEAQSRVGDFFGPTVNRAARIMAVGHGGQVLLSAATAALVMDQLPDGAMLRDLGEHRLKDLGRPEHLFQLVHPGLLGEFPPLATLNYRPNNLPVQASSFVGRDAELKEIRGRLVDAGVRLLTLTGPGGTGKTRLALRVAAELIDMFDDGVFFVDLSTVGDTPSVLAAIARAIGVSETTGQSLLEDLKRRLRQQRLLLVLDNFEQVTAAAPTMVELLSECAGLKLLVTSREQLHVRGEQLFSVRPLSSPTARTGHWSAVELARYEAVQLFVDRAQAVSAGFALTDKNAPAVAEICLRLDGLPLAIELATARIRLFSPEALRDRLRSRLRALGSGARDLPARQRTLRTTIDWSFQLLEPSEQRLLELFSVFSGAALEAVEVVAAEVEWLSGTDVVDGMASLLDKSLIRQADSGDGEPRLVMLETIREFAAERLDDLPEFSAAARRAHAGYFAEFAQRQWADLTGPGREPALAALAADIDNLRLAWRYWVAAGDLIELNWLVDSLWLLYDAQGWYQATIELTTDLLQVLDSTPPTPERAAQEITLQTSLARALMAMSGYTNEVEQAYTRAMRLFEGRDFPQLFPVLRSLATFYNFRAEFDKGAQVGREILRLAEQLNDTGMLVDGHLVLGSSLVFLNDLHAGLEHLDQAIEYFQSQPHRSQRFRLGNNPGVACFTTSAFVCWLLGYPDGALQRADEAVALATELEHPFTLAYALFHSGFLHWWRREPERAKDRAVGVLQVVEDHEFPIWGAVGTCLLGAANTWMGQTDEGLAQIQRGMDLYQGLRSPPIFWQLLLFLQAGAQARAGRTDEGLVLIDEALEIADRGSGMTLLPEFCLLKGDLLLGLPQTNSADAEQWFQRACDIAQGLDARMPQLRAAVQLCRLWRDGDKAEEGIRRLRGIYDTFTEGFTTTDLIDATEQLDSLGVRPP